MAGEGEVRAWFDALVWDAADAGEKIGDSYGSHLGETAAIADRNAAQSVSADAENARAFEAIRPKSPDVLAGRDPVRPGEDSGPGNGNRFASTLNPKDDGGAPVPKWGITKPLLDRYRGEEKFNRVWLFRAVRHLSESERAKYKLTVKDGKLYDAKGNLFDTSDARSVHAFHPRAIFVMDSDGNIYASKWQKAGKFVHSSFLAGGDVAGAGEIEVIKGEVKLINNASGHYKPTRDMTMQVVKELRSRGMAISDKRVHSYKRL